MRLTFALLVLGACQLPVAPPTHTSDTGDENAASLGVTGPTCATGEVVGESGPSGETGLTGPTGTPELTLCEKAIAGVTLPSGALSVKADFGAVADGVTDDFDAMQAAADYVADHPGTTIIYPPGTYRIDRYNPTYYGTAAGFPANNDPALDLAHRTQGVSYDYAHDFVILGCQAKIDVKGNFTKNATYNYGPILGPEDSWQPDEWQKSAFSFYFSHHFEISGFEIDGNVDQMSANPLVNMEQRDWGILSVNSHDYYLHHLNVHHFAADGLILGLGTIDSNVRIDHVTSGYNARQGMSLIQTSNVHVTNSKFHHTGITTNPATGTTSFGPLNTSTGTGFSPGAGVDVEPDCKLPNTAVGYCPGFDVRSTNIIFEDCEFTDNTSWGLAHGHGDVVDFVVVRRSLFVMPPGGGGTPLFMSNGLAEDNEIHAEKGYVWLISGLTQATDSLIFRRNTLHGTRQLMRVTGVAKVWIEDNNIHGDYSDYDPVADPAIWRILELNDVRSTGPATWKFSGNKLTITGAPFQPSYSGDSTNVSVFAE